MRSAPYLKRAFRGNREQGTVTRTYDFEKLKVYQKAIAFCKEAFASTGRLGFMYQSSLGDQLRRSALSVCNNIAEGSGKETLRAKRSALGYALDSARECVPMFTLMEDLELLPRRDLSALRSCLWEITSMLFTWRKNLSAA